MFDVFRSHKRGGWVSSFKPIQPVNLRNSVVEQMRIAIIEGRLRPGNHLTETSLTKLLGVSRTPVREALILLEREGLVVAEPNRGVFVRAFSEEDVDAIFSMRTTLENFAAERIIDSLVKDDFERLLRLIKVQTKHIEEGDFKEVRTTDMAFHQYLVERAHHPLLTRAWNELVAQIAAVLYLRAEAIPDYDETMVIQDHEAIVEAFRARDLNTVRAHHARINRRVALECRLGVRGVGVRDVGDMKEVVA